MNFLLIAVCLGAGFSLRVSRILPEDAHKGINAWILYVAFPGVALHYLPSIRWTYELALPLAMPFVVWFGALLLLRGFRLNGRTFGALLLTAGVANTSFVGFPLTQAYLGAEGLRIAVICDQLTFILLSTIGIVAAMHCAHSGAFDARRMIIGLLRFPPFVAFVAALTVPRVVSLSAVDPLLRQLGSTLVPLALFSVGMQIRFSEWRDEIRLLCLGLGYKLVVAPALLFAIALVFGIRGIAAQTSVFEGAMAPSITAAIVAAEYDLNPRLANLMASLGIMLSFLTTAGWAALLRFLA